MSDDEYRAWLAGLKEKLAQFLQEIGSCGRGDIKQSSVMEPLSTSYRSLYGHFRYVDEEDLKEFEKADVQAIDCLGLGQKYAGHFYRKTATCLSQSGPETAQKIVLMLRSTAGYKMAHGMDLGTPDVPDLFGDDGFAGEIAEKLKAEMRAEELGRILGYAVSGLWEEHGSAWRDGAQLRVEHDDQVDFYLQDVIRASEKVAEYRFEHRGDQNATAMKIWDDSGAPELRERAEERVEHCFIGANNFINIGASFSQDYDKTICFAKAVLAAAALTGKQTIGGRPNPYHGFQVQAYCYMTGYPGLLDFSGELLPGVADAPLMALFSKNPDPILGQAFSNLFPVVAGSVRDA